MKTTPNLQDLAEAAVRNGKEVRRDVAAAVAAAARTAGTIAGGFTEVVQQTFAGAARAVNEVVPADRESVLRQVVDGVGDGLSLAAHAAELTVRELGGDAARAAGDEISKLGDAFGGAPRVFVKTVRDAAVRTGGHVADMAEHVASHAGATLRRIEPSLAKAADALRKPGQLGRETLAAGAAAARGAAGAFLEALGRKIQALGKDDASRRDRDGGR